MPKLVLKNGLRVHYQRVGRGPDLVMIHGLTGNLAVWHLHIIPVLLDRFRILTYDLRGHGYTEMPSTGYSATEMANDLAALLDTLEIERPSIVGHSFGADIALYFALRYPNRVQRLVAMEAALPALTSVRAQKDWLGWSYWADVLERAGVSVPPERRFDTDYLIRQSLLIPKKWGPLNGLPRNPEPFLRLLDTTTVVQDYQDVGDLTVENISRITCPVTLMYGEDSSLISSYDCLRARLPDVDAVLLPRTDLGHFGPMEQPELVAAHLLGKLDTDTRPVPARNGAVVQEV
jgi:pimeloyl-ACP methyl ester carboxylesterase